MPLPKLIEIVPPTESITAQITVPGSKSITNRALILAALANGEVRLHGALWSEDTEVMAGALTKLGFEVGIAADPREPCNRAITVQGLAGRIPRAGTEAEPLEIFVGNAGTAARFLAPMLCLGNGVYRLHGVARMHERPQAALFSALRELGYRIESTNDRLPAIIHGSGPRPGKCTVSISESSQFASGLILSSLPGGWKIGVEGENDEESPYVRMTHELVAAFPHQGGEMDIEPDASSGSYFIAAQELLPAPEIPAGSKAAAKAGSPTRSHVLVVAWPKSGWQVDARFPEVLFEGSWISAITDLVKDSGEAFERITISRARDLGDSIMTAIILAPFAREPIKFTDLGRLRLQECERVMALRTELTRCGARVVESGDTLEVFPSRLHGAEIETYNDHRIAMCFAILGLKIPGITIKQPACVKKTFPNFFQ
jgi:3-phosphoshikimate 1-carboxyvinyltransferase